MEVMIPNKVARFFMAHGVYPDGSSSVLWYLSLLYVKCSKHVCLVRIVNSTSVLLVLRVSVSTVPLSELFKKSSDSWDCSTCFVTNKNAASVCVACTVPKSTQSVVNLLQYISSLIDDVYHMPIQLLNVL